MLTKFKPLAAPEVTTSAATSDKNVVKMTFQFQSTHPWRIDMKDTAWDSQFAMMSWASNVITIFKPLTHWGRVTHICVGKLTISGSDNGLSPGRRQAIIWTNAKILLIRPLGTNFSEIFNKIHIFLFNKIHLKMSSGKWRPFCLGLNELTCHDILMPAP